MKRKPKASDYRTVGDEHVLRYVKQYLQEINDVDLDQLQRADLVKIALLLESTVVELKK